MQKYALAALTVTGLGLLLWGGLHRSALPARVPAAVAGKINPTAAAAKTPAIAAQTLPAPVSSPLTSKEEEERRQALNKILTTQACYENQQCDFPQTDPKSYEYAVGQSLAQQLRVFRQRFPAATVDLNTLAREYVASPDAFVQSEALDILATLPTSPENLKALSEGVETSTDPSLIQKSLVEFKRYLGTPQEAQVHETLAKIIDSGAHFTSQTVAEEIAPFINASSLERYRRTVTNMSAETTAAKNLQTALEEFERHQTGS